MSSPSGLPIRAFFVEATNTISYLVADPATKRAAAIDLDTDGSDFDALFSDGEHFAIGSLDVLVLDTPGHTPAYISYKIGDAVFVGDTLFMPDDGTARGFSGRRRRQAVPADPAAVGAAAPDAAFHVP
jgi:glyoxylase-like metal-dependent hydrolase (beta-lactamase superfamily II)